MAVYVAHPLTERCRLQWPTIQCVRRKQVEEEMQVRCAQYIVRFRETAIGTLVLGWGIYGGARTNTLGGR